MLGIQALGIALLTIRYICNFKPEKMFIFALAAWKVAKHKALTFVSKKLLVVEYLYFISSCLSDVPSHFHGDNKLPTPQSWSTGFESFKLKFVIMSV